MLEEEIMKLRKKKKICEKVNLNFHDKKTNDDL